MFHPNRPVAAIFLAVASAFAYAQEAAYDFDIPAQPVSQTLGTIARQNGLQPIFAEDAVKGIQSPGVKGKLNLRDALTEALAGTGLTFQFTGEKAVAIKLAPHTEKAALLPAIEVRESTAPNYSKPNSTTAAKIDVPNRDIPQSIQVRPAELLEDLGGPPRVDELLKTVSGVTKYALGPNGSNYPTVMMRGFASNYILRNGYQPTANYNAIVDMANVEQVEVLKGPSSVLNGYASSSSGLGGVINLITKKPTAETAYGGSVMAGSWNFQREQAYLNGAINEAKTVLLRVDGALEKADSFQKYTSYDNRSFAPAATILIGDKDTVNLRYDTTTSTAHGGTGIPISPLYAQVPKDTWFGDPAHNWTKTTSWNALAEYVHKFDNGWKATLIYSDNKTTVDFDRSNANQVVGNNVRIQAGWGRIEQEDKNTEVRVDGHFQTGSIDHYLLAGYSHKDYVGPATSNISGNATVTLPYLGPYNYTSAPIVMTGGIQIQAYSHYMVDAYYLQDLITLSEQFKLLVGARNDKINKINSGSGFLVVPVVPYPASGNTNDSWNHTSPRVGLVYQPTAATSLYAGYSTSFNPAAGADFSGKSFAPESGKQIEFGAKQIFSDRLDANVALYQLTRGNMLTADLAHPGFNVTIGEQRVRGLEVDINGQIISSLRFNFAYSHIFQAEVTATTAAATPVGSKLAGVPVDSANLFGIYSFGGNLAGLEAGGGINYTSAVKAALPSAALPNPYSIGSTLQVDAMASYKFNKTTKLQLSLKNLTNHANYYTAGGTVAVGTPRAAYLNLKIDL
ncbi:MAG TPA: TonB-dependent receptor [Azospira sp.]|nr:TonB-dependent receptor [Accumulibacter sp.]HNN45727.1 TonB-dependent receptor [Azospira sp.]